MKIITDRWRIILKLFSMSMREGMNGNTDFSGRISRMNIFWPSPTSAAVSAPPAMGSVS
jgi:hypothetical protein